MKKVLCGTLLVFFVLSIFAVNTFAATYQFISFTDSNDFTIVKQDTGITENISVVGYKADYTSEPVNATWTTSNSNVAKFLVNGQEVVSATGSNVTVKLVGVGEAVITATYDSLTVPSNIVVEDKNAVPKNVVPSDIVVNVDGIDAPDTIFNGNNGLITCFDIADVVNTKGQGSADVLTKDVTALHALLYALEVENDDDNVVDMTDPAWDWDWVTPSRVTVSSEGTYVEKIAGDDGYTGYPNGWQFKVGGVNGTSPEKAASILKLEDNKSTAWKFTTYPWN